MLNQKVAKANHMGPRISLVIATYNARLFLKDCLTSVMETDYDDFDLIVVDNGSTDGSDELLKKLSRLYTNINVIRHSKNSGHAEGCNIGARVAKGKYLVFLDSDTIVSSTWLKKLIDVLETNEDIGIVQPKYVYLAKEGRYVRSIGETLIGQADEMKEYFESFGTASVALAIRRDLFEVLKGFDPLFFAYYDDADLCWRTWLEGFRVARVPRSIVYHYSSKIEEKPVTPQILIFHMKKNTLMMAIKNYELKSLLKYLPACFIFFYFGPIAYRSVHQGLSFLFHPKYVFANLSVSFKSLLWVMIEFKRIWKERLRVQHSRKVLDADISARAELLLSTSSLKGTLRDRILKK